MASSNTHSPASHFKPVLAPFEWETISDRDPRVNGRTLQMNLLVRLARCLNAARPTGSSAKGRIEAKKFIISPVVFSENKDPVYDLMEFEVAGERYPPQMVQILFTPEQGANFRHQMLAIELARARLTSENEYIRYKCKVLGYEATSSDPAKLVKHVAEDHPGAVLSIEMVMPYHINGP